MDRILNNYKAVRHAAKLIRNFPLSAVNVSALEHLQCAFLHFDHNVYLLSISMKSLCIWRMMLQHFVH